MSRRVHITIEYGFIFWDSKVRDIHEWLMQIGCRTPLPCANDTPVTVTYHESCHLTHGQKVTRQPRDLLRLLPAVKLVELTESSWCCGSAGVYSIPSRCSPPCC